MVNIDDIKKLREETGAGIADVKLALEDSDGDLKIAREFLKRKGLEKASKKSEREVKSGWVEVYSHNGRVGVALELLCETDFVAKTPDFRDLAHEIALQIASMNPQDVEGLLGQEYIRDSSQTIKQLIASTVGKLGENIQVGKFVRIVLGE